MITIPGFPNLLPIPTIALTSGPVQDVLVPVAYNVLALIFVVLGLYLMFAPEVKTYVIPAAKAAAKTGAEAAEVA